MTYKKFVKEYGIEVVSAMTSNEPAQEHGEMIPWYVLLKNNEGREYHLTFHMGCGHVQKREWRVNSGDGYDGYRDKLARMQSASAFKPWENVHGGVWYDRKDQKFYPSSVRPSEDKKRLVSHSGRGATQYDIDSLNGGLYRLSPPDAETILYSIGMDCQSLQYAPTFREWASELGYNPDSISDRNVFEACQKEAEDAQKWLGPEAYLVLLTCTEEEQEDAPNPDEPEEAGMAAA